MQIYKVIKVGMTPMSYMNITVKGCIDDDDNDWYTVMTINDINTSSRRVFVMQKLCIMI